MSGFLNKNANSNKNSTPPQTIRFANHVQFSTLSSHDTAAADKKNKAQADSTITMHMNVIAVTSIVSFSTNVSLV